jgi:hypothetical protein
LKAHPDFIGGSRETFAIADSYVPVKRRATHDQNRVNEVAASILEKGQQTLSTRFILRLSSRERGSLQGQSKKQNSNAPPVVT